MRDPDGKHFEGATSLAALAASTELVRIGAGWFERVIGTRGPILQHADALADAGVDELAVGVGDGPDGYDLGELRELVRWRDSRG